MKLYSVSLLILCFISLWSCQETDSEIPAHQMELGDQPMNPRQQPEEIPEEPQQAVDTTRKLIKAGQIEFATDDLDATRSHIMQAIDSHRGYVSADRAFSRSNRVSQILIVRIPVEQFDDFLQAISQEVTYFDRKTIEVKDVTAEYLDIQSRLDNKKALEARYGELLQQASSVSDVLAIEKEMGELRADIESIEGRLKYLSNQVAYSTLTITFYKNIAHPQALGKRIREGFSNGWQNFISFGVGLVNLWPFIILLALLVLGWRTWRRERK